MLHLFILIFSLILSGNVFAQATETVQAWEHHDTQTEEIPAKPVDLQKYLADTANLPELAAADKTELDAFYTLRGYHAAWNLSDAEAIQRSLAFLDSAKAVITYHGLALGPYHIEEIRKLAADKGGDRAKMEMLITADLLHLAHDLRGETLDLNDIYTGWNFHRAPVNVPVLLNTAINTGKLGKFFDTLAPQNQSYRDLAKALQDYRAIQSHGEWPSIKSGPALHPHDSDDRIAQLHARLTAEGYNADTANDARDFDTTLSETLTIYQRRNGLQPDGQLGARTLEALNTSVAARIEQIRANMERWRHMPATYPPENYVQINIPDFTIAITEDGKEIYRGDVVVGKTDRQTPFVASKITNMVVNPSWHVPLDIARKDILPKLKKNPHYLETLGIVITGRDIDPTGATIDWVHMKPENFNYQLRQEPGDINSLGQLKFSFANPFDVYMHGTPHQELFAKAERTFSSGCVRLEDPMRVGEILLSHNKDDKGPGNLNGLWDQQHIQDEIDSDKTRFVPLAKPMPIYLLYWSVFTDPDGQTNFRRDIYGYDADLTDQFKN